ncbi:MAG TPA: clostripain-related cysteine peptidase [Pyrinomonadaceae bacterium]|jgi:hypothetical protein|nr:clostripain-related cysteine peptidase [Pyrinomonadaceae bacterium]
MQTKEWTLMFYFASDNPLASTIVSQLKAIKDAGYHPDANVIAQFDPHASTTPVHVFDVNSVNKFHDYGLSKVGFTGNDPFVRDLVLDRLWSEKNDDIRKKVIAHVKGNPEHNPGSVFNPPKPFAQMSGEQNPKEALKSFLNFCHLSYPARHYMLFILGHGQVVGNDSLLFDDHAERHSLTLIELGEVLRGFNSDVINDREPGVVELVALHSCSMSAMEVAYELKGAANYMLASQGPMYVGNLPYRQILIRIFNDLNAKLSPADINGGGNGKQSLVEKLSKPSDPVSHYLRDRLSQKTSRFLEFYKSGTTPDSDLVSTIVQEISDLIENEDLTKTAPFPKAVTTNGNGRIPPKASITSENLRRLNRLRLSDAFPEIARYPKQDLEKLLSKIFYYSVYNSYDFQLAGYPYDLCLSNLTKLSDVEEPINQLADKLINGLKDDNPTPRQLIILAHWDAQSFYQEDYVDLYDFCFCLMKRCKERLQDWGALPILNEIHNACDKLKEALEKGPNKLVTLSAFSGAAFQYAHGFSIYFPWTKPMTSRMWDEEYSEYRLNMKTRWRDFLNVYFETTMRKTREEELGRTPKGITDNILALISQIGAHVFAGDGSLDKPGPDSPMGKYGPDDPFGAGSCNCPTIKNYPSHIGMAKRDDGKEVPVHLSEDFFEGQTMVSDSDDLNE